MKKAAVILMAAVMFSAAVPTSSTRAAAGVDKGVVSAEYLIVTATVESIDQERRIVTLKSPDGKTIILKASKKVKDLDEINKGDQVSAEYLDTVAVIVRKPDGKSHPGFLKEVTVAPVGKSSSGLPVDTVESLNTVEAVDYDKRTVTVREPSGSLRTYKVDERVKKFRQISKGDQVYLRVTEPLAIRILPVEK